MSSWILNLFLSSPLSPSILSSLLFFSSESVFSFLFASTINLSSSLSCQLYLPISLSLLCAFPVLPLCSLFRHSACSPGGVGCSGEESSGLRSSPALGRQLLFIQPETQAGSAAAPGRTLHRQVRNRCKHTLAYNPNLYVSPAIGSC